MRRLEFYALIQNNANAIDWSRSNSLISECEKCPTCSSLMKLASHSGGDSQIWRCRKSISGTSQHDIKVSIRKGSIFEASTLPIRIILFCMYEWAAMTTVEQTSYELSLDAMTVTTWFRKFRNVTSQLVETRLIAQIGATDDIIEIDECQIGRRKHHRGRRRNEVWLLGMVVRGASPPCLFIQDVTNRNRRTLEPIIQRHVNRSSRIITDGWRAYSRLTTLGYRHSVVVHERNFVAPEDPSVHTQNVENLWRCQGDSLTTAVHTGGHIL